MNESTTWSKYYEDVKRDFEEARKEYPFIEMTILPTREPQPIIITAIAVEKRIIDATLARKEDFLDEYSKRIVMKVPCDYQEAGCVVYGAKWLEISRIPKEDLHIYSSDMTQDGYVMCVGTPESFPLLDNVILENIRTADAMLVAYEKVMRGIDDSLNLIAYAHGDKGRKQFEGNRRRYISR
ncbi:MAG: hypothetical protein LUD18_05270 [Lachnospiraceae bacterium]|nr:hypothetical protein [Lachnospiraceae bacterium]